MQEWYLTEVTSIKGGRPSILESLNSINRSFNLKEMQDFSKTINNHAMKLKWGWDIPLMMLKLMANWDYAKDNGNKYLLRESLHGFPIMNYALNEGPFKVGKEAVFGGEDFHVVLRGDDNNLIYFTPDEHGLKQGRYVECLL